MTTLLHSSMLKGKTLDELKNKHTKVQFKETDCEGLDENQPLILRIPDGTFFGPVMPNRIRDVIVDNANDIKIQTSRLFDVEMKKYMSEPMYRKTVLQCRIQLEELDNWTNESISEVLDTLAKANKQSIQDVRNSMKVAMLKTTKGPVLEDILIAYGKKDALKRIDSYLEEYKFRY